jgi:hypothetical protein
MKEGHGVREGRRSLTTPRNQMREIRSGAFYKETRLLYVI